MAIAASGGSGDGSAIVVGDEQGLARLEAALLDRHRGMPSIVLTQRSDGPGPVLAPQSVRVIVGPAPRIYFIASDQLLRKLRVRLGAALTVRRGALRIFWPELSVQSDPLAHPLVEVLQDEPLGVTLAELARQFDLSRPVVRAEIKLLDDARAMAEAEANRLRRELKATAKQLHQTTAQLNEARKQAASTQHRLDELLNRDQGDRR